MTPEETAFAFETSALGQVLAALIAVALVGLYLRWEWAVSKSDRERRRKAKADLMGDRLIDATGAIGAGGARRRILREWQRQWRRSHMRAKWGQPR